MGFEFIMYICFVLRKNSVYKGFEEHMFQNLNTYMSYFV